MNKLNRLLRIKALIVQAKRREERAQLAIKNLIKERAKVVATLTKEDIQLYKDRIDKACKD